MKRNPILTSVLTTGLLVYGGAVTLGFGVLIGVLVDSTAIPAAGMIYAGIKSPNFHKKHKTGNRLVFEMITLSE